MIHLLLTRAHAYTLQQYLDTWGRDVRPFFRPLFFDDLAFGADLKPGTYIFADLERLDEAGMELARLAWGRLAARPADFRLLNDPSKVLLRYDLLRELHAAGINRFAAHRMNNGSLPKRFPVFLRRASEHDGALSALIHSPQELDRAAADLVARGAPAGDLLAVEYCETADDAGIYRKYSAFRVGEHVMARHLFHSRKWVLKKADLVDPGFVEEERVYLTENPHERELRRVFDLAHIEYGRMDYSVLDGVVQVWEINTNPMIAVPPCRTVPDRLLGQGLFARQLQTAFESADHGVSGPPQRIIVPASLARRLGVTLRTRAARSLARTLSAAARHLSPADAPR